MVRTRWCHGTDAVVSRCGRAVATRPYRGLGNAVTRRCLRANAVRPYVVEDYRVRWDYAGERRKFPRKMARCFVGNGS